uniref:UMP-CMP kinase n=1 Tax=Cuerna arida TaxID=1464854 RepID=A0A1B6EIT6_9HEMI
MRQNLVLQFCKQIFKMGDVLKPKVVFVLGGPGAGKGTQCANIVKEFGFVHLSAGDLLREERSKPGTKYGELIEEHIRNGSIVPVEITCKLIEMAMQNSGKQKFLIDGFPRNENNLEGWNKAMAEKVELLFVLFFDCSQDICVQRCLKRGAQGSGRSDDNEESLKKRIQTFVNDSMPIIEHFKERKLVHRIDADQEPNEVFEDVKAIFQNIP